MLFGPPNFLSVRAGVSGSPVYGFEPHSRPDEESSVRPRRARTGAEDTTDCKNHEAPRIFVVGLGTVTRDVG